MGPVEALRREGATAIIVQGIGGRPLMGLRQAGIEVLAGPGARVSEVVQAFLAGEVRAIDASAMCAGHDHPHGAHGHGHGHGQAGNCRH